jgi:alpha-glucosidase
MIEVAVGTLRLPIEAFAGWGRADAAMNRGNFRIEDRVEARLPLVRVGDGLLGVEGGRPLLRVAVEPRPGGATLRFDALDARVNRLWLRLPAEPGEAVWGGGEQMSYLDLRGRRYPIWTSEPGVGRDKTTLVTMQADVAGDAGGDYWTTNFPQPTFLSSRGYAAHLGTTAWSALDFRDPAYHELEWWAGSGTVELDAGDPAALARLNTRRFGSSPALPGWVGDGVILGLKRGEAHALEKLEVARRAGIPVAALWCEDWAGVRRTSFGTRLFWDWRWSRERYPALDRLIPRLRGEGVRFLGYANPYLCDDGALFPEAAAAGHLALGPDGEVGRVDFGEFACGTLDMTSEAACAWFRDRVLREGMLDLGMSGWMADFGEYLPTDLRLRAGDPWLEHNRWPVRWAVLNADATAGRDEAVFFMRAGFTGAPRHCPLLWAGDQCVDFSRHDGLVTAVTGAVSAGLVGVRHHHGDIGGYTSLFGLKRTPELFMRWAELAAFTAAMRTHEGNRPEENFQWWESEAAMAHLARMAGVFRRLAPYRAGLEPHLPWQRALPLHFPEDRGGWACHDQFLLGPDLLVAPVHAAGAETWEAWLPEGADWVHAWSGRRFPGGQRMPVPAPLGQPPVFARAGAEGVLDALH